MGVLIEVVSKNLTRDSARNPSVLSEFELLVLRLSCCNISNNHLKQLVYDGTQDLTSLRRLKQRITKKLDATNWIDAIRMAYERKLFKGVDYIEESTKPFAAILAKNIVSKYVENDLSIDQLGSELQFFLQSSINAFTTGYSSGMDIKSTQLMLNEDEVMYIKLSLMGCPENQIYHHKLFKSINHGEHYYTVKKRILTKLNVKNLFRAIKRCGYFGLIENDYNNIRDNHSILIFTTAEKIYAEFNKFSLINEEEKVLTAIIYNHILKLLEEFEFRYLFAENLRSQNLVA